MAVKLFCPHCSTPFIYVSGDAETEVGCLGCGGKYLPSEARRSDSKPEPVSEPRPTPGVGARSRRERTSPDTGRPRQNRRPDSDPDWDRGNAEDPEAVRATIRSAAISLLAMWLLGSPIGLLFVGLALFGLILPGELGPGARAEQPAMLALGAAYAMGVPLGIYGAIQMLRRTSRSWAIASALLLFIGYLGCIPAWGVSFWVLSVLNRPAVRAAFNRTRPETDDV